MIAVAGCGHPDRGDDAVGLLVARAIERSHLPGVQVRFPATDGLALLQAWEGCEACIVIDAMVSGRAPGTVLALSETDWDRLRTPPACSTHSLGPAAALRLAAAIGALPPRVVVIGVEGFRFEAGADLSPEVRAAIGPATELVAAEVAEHRAG
jgi:hydrogenase maturation protease